MNTVIFDKSKEKYPLIMPTTTRRQSKHV